MQDSTTLIREQDTPQHTVYRSRRKEAAERRNQTKRTQRTQLHSHRDTLRQLLNDQSIFINQIQYENSERLIDNTDTTSIIKAAYFRKDGSIRITDSPEVETLHGARSEKMVRWSVVRE